MADNSIKIINEISRIFTPIAERIGESGKFGWETVLHQQVIYGWVMLTISVLSLISVICLVAYLAKLILLHQGARELRGLVLISISVFILSFMFFLAQGLLHLLNPSFYSLQFFITLIQP